MKKKTPALHAAHPIQGLSTLLRLSWLLLIPIVQRALIQPESIWESLRAALLNLSIVTLVFAGAALRWRSERYRFERNRFLFYSGIWTRKRFVLPISQIDCIYVTRTLPCALFGAELLTLESRAATRLPDAELYLSRRAARPFLPDRTLEWRRARRLPLLLTALSWSNAASGLLITAPFLQKAGQLFGDELHRLIDGRFDPRLLLISAGVPPLAAGIAWALFGGWLAAFLFQLAACAPFRCAVHSGFWITRCGVLPRRVRLFRTRRIAAVTVRQTLLMRVTGVCSLLAHISGDERLRDCRPFLLAAATEPAAAEAVAQIVPKDDPVVLSPPQRAVRRYLLPVFAPLLLLSLLLIALNLLRVPSSFVMILFPLLILLIWRCLVRFTEIPFARAEIGPRTLRLCRMSGLSLLATSVQWENIASLRIRQTLFQKRAGLCTLDVFVRGKRARRCTVRHLDAQALNAALADHRKSTLKG